jgi:PadR family transcriptional regulator AphA
MSAVVEPSFAEHVCLALVAQGVSHGWALGSMLARDGEIGRIWTLSRPLTYRAIDGLADKGLVARDPEATRNGRERVLLETTPSGRRAVRAWLDAPVQHLRDVRTELLVKLELRRRAGLEIDNLLRAQQAEFDDVLTKLTSSGPDDDLVTLWRRESARAVRRFLDAARRPAVAPAAVPPPDLRLSARNQLRGTITAVHHGDVMSTIKAVLGDGQPVTAAITKDAAEELDLAPGDQVVMVVKSTEVIIALA